MEDVVSDITRRPWDAGGVEAINRSILRGEDPYEYVKTTNGGTGNVQNYFNNPNIIEDNLLNFKQIGFDLLKPYRAIAEAMDATKQVKSTVQAKRVVTVKPKDAPEYDKEIDVYEEIWDEAPDHATRLQAAKMALALLGHDPHRIDKLQVNVGANAKVQAHIGDLYLEIAGMSEEDALSRYNDVKRLEARQEVILLPSEYRLHGQDTEVPTPNGAAGILVDREDRDALADGIFPVR